jgi:polysaccharide pyruvyl transferase WcaK-like protein
VHLLTGDSRADNATVVAVMERFNSTSRTLNHLHAPLLQRFEDVVALLGLVDVVVGSRFHNVLLALMLGRPAVSIGYSDKNDALMDDFGLGGYCHNIESFDVRLVLDQLRQLLLKTDDTTRELPDRLQAARAALDVQYDAFCARLLSDCAPGIHLRTERST